LNAVRPPEPPLSNPEATFRAFLGAIVTLQAIGYVWLGWIFFTRNSPAFAQVIAIAAYSLAGLNAIVALVDLIALRAKREPPLARASLMLAVPAFVAAVAAFLLL
jgi:hypothetical protein